MSSEDAPVAAPSEGTPAEARERGLIDHRGRWLTKKLHKKADLVPNEVLVNLREDKQILTYIFYCKHKLTISADVYSLSKDEPDEPESTPAPAKPPAPSGACEKSYWKCMRECASPDCPEMCKKKKAECETRQPSG